MNDQAFVGRQRELGRLQAWLELALGGQSQVCFVAGEAGSGKTTLIQEFARHAAAVHPELVIATGNCNSQTGTGDPYLPFREVFRLLMGDVEAEMAPNVINIENASRLRRLVGSSTDVLAETAPDVLELMLATIPGGGIITKLSMAVAKKSGLMNKEDEKKGDKGKESKTPELTDPNLDQTRIFEQYTNVLRTLAEKQPLVLIIDDLQWSDAGSVYLLFHLSRRLEQSRVLMVGTYRPDEIALGRGDERHPMEKVLAEIKRYLGDVQIDLDESRNLEGQQFVDALLDCEPNALDQRFREGLFQHTSAHPLFVVELIREMKERGDLIQDERGRWIEGPSLDWREQPARVEGVIEERIGRLEEELHEILNVASVEGVSFTAQVVAKVQDMRERQLLQELTRELGNRHHLVRELGEVKAGRQFLSRYEFTQAPFQSYLYSELGKGQRRLLHGEIARTLEELYADRTEQITLQLAHHYAESGDTEKALSYLLQAAERARSLYANDESIEAYQRAVTVLKEDSDVEPAKAQHIYEGLGDVLELTGQHERARSAFESALENMLSRDVTARARLHRKIGKTWEPQRGYDEALQAYDKAEEMLGPPSVEAGPEWWQEWVQIQLVRMWIFHWRGQWREMASLVEKIRPAVEQYGTPTQRSKFFTALVLAAFGRDRYVVTDETLANAGSAMSAMQETGSPSEIALTGIILGLCHLWRGESERAKEELMDALKLAEQTGDVIAESRSLAYLTSVYRQLGDTKEVRRLAERGLSVSTAAQMLEDSGMCMANLAWASWQEGDMNETRKQGHAALEIWRKLPLTTHFRWLALLPLIAASLAQNEDAEAVLHARAQLDPDQQRLPDSLTEALEHGVRSGDAGDQPGARASLQEAVTLAKQLSYL